MSVNDLIAEGIRLFESNNFDEAITKLNLALNEIEDKNSQIEEQSDIQCWLGRCYFEQALLNNKDVDENKELFEQAVIHYKWLFELAQKLTNKQARLQKQEYAQFFLGQCCLEWAIKTKDTIEAKGLFKKAIEHYQQQLKFVKQLVDSKINLGKHNNVRLWLSYCYFAQAKKIKGVVEAKKLFEKAINYLQQNLELAKQRQDLQEQKENQMALGRCYFEQAVRIKNVVEVKHLFEQAVVHYQQQFNLTQQLQDEQEQNNSLSWLGRCYFEQAIRTKNVVEVEVEVKHLFEQAVARYQQQFNLAQKLQDEQEQNNALSWLSRCYFEQAVKTKDVTEAKKLFKQAIESYKQQLKLSELLKSEKERKRNKKIARLYLRNICFLRKKWVPYFNKKKQEIYETLFSNEDKDFNKTLKDAISTILTVLHIPPIELGSTPLAHYTSSTVCNKLFGVLNEDGSSPMRIGSSSYMNDPSEGKGLLELLALQDFELENKADCSPHNAFFACFSSRVNDLNQFRLYGKEDGVEASGCCLVFNKNGDWLKEPDISAPFRSFIKNQDENSATFKKADLSNVECENLPLYQVAYIAYKDDYITKEKCGIWLNDSKFGICLKPIGENNEWHNFRIEKLEEALQQLIDFFKVKDNVNDQNKNALEYIRYLFKDFAFRDEEEFRVLKIAEIGSEEIKYCEKTQSIYLPYADISNMVDEVILGTNYEKTNSRRKAEVFQHEMKRKYLYVDVSRSSLPIYANPPIKKD